MSKNFFDYTDGNFVYTGSGNTAINSEGEILIRMSDTMALNVDSGEIHTVSGWHDDDDDD